MLVHLNILKFVSLYFLFIGFKILIVLTTYFVYTCWGTHLPGKTHRGQRATCENQFGTDFGLELWVLTLNLSHQDWRHEFYLMHFASSAFPLDGLSVIYATLVCKVITGDLFQHTGVE